MRFFVLIVYETKIKRSRKLHNKGQIQTVYNSNYIFIVFLHVRRKVIVLDGLGVFYKYTKQFTIIGQI